MKLIKNARIITMDPQRTTYDHGAIAIEGSRITDIGESAVLEQKYTDAEIIDARGMLVIPGLINAHTHIFQCLYKGLGDDAIAIMSTLSPDRIVYISCDPATQARDCKKLIEHGYVPQKMKLYDMFPRTEHIESCMVLERE